MGRFCLSVNTLLYRTSRRTAFGVRFKERLGQVQQGRHNPLAPLSKTHRGRTGVYGGSIRIPPGYFNRSLVGAEKGVIILAPAKKYGSGRFFM